VGKRPELIVDGPEVPLVYAQMRRIVERLSPVLGEARAIDRWLVVPPDKLFFELPTTADGANQVTIRRLAEDEFEVVFERHRRQPPEAISRHAPLREAELPALFAQRLGRRGTDHHRTDHDQGGYDG
jgi:hypothetical protein